MQTMSEERRPKWRKHVTGGLLGALVGFAGAAAVMAAEERGLLGTLGNSEVIALLVALVYLLMGLAVAVGAGAPGIGARFLNVEDAGELREQRAAMIPSALGCLLFAVGLAALALGRPEGVLSPPAAIVLFLLSLSVGGWASLRTRRASDELMRQVMRDSAATSYYAMFFVLGGWAALAHLRFVQAPAMLDIVTLFYAVALVAAFWTIGRRGMMMR